VLTAVSCVSVLHTVYSRDGDADGDLDGDNPLLQLYSVPCTTCVASYKLVPVRTDHSVGLDL